MELKFQSRWLERCVRDYLGVGDRPVTAEDVSVIKYLYVSTTNGYMLGFGKGVLPKNFSFSDAGDEWDCRCLSDTARFGNSEAFIDIRDWGDCKEISIKSTLLEDEYDNEEPEVDGYDHKESEVDGHDKEDDLQEDEYGRENNEGKETDDADIGSEGMEAFEGSVRIYVAEDSDFEGLERDEDTYDYGLLIPEDFAHFTNLEVVRLMSCETEIHSLAFLKALSKLRVLEVGEVRLNTLDGLEKLVGLEKLCVWAN